jgi:hypothetical protein
LSKKQEIEVIVTRKYAEGTAYKDVLLDAFIRVILAELKDEEAHGTFDNDAQQFDNG